MNIFYFEHGVIQQTIESLLRLPIYFLFFLVYVAICCIITKEMDEKPLRPTVTPFGNIQKANAVVKCT